MVPVVRITNNILLTNFSVFSLPSRVLVHGNGPAATRQGCYEGGTVVKVDPLHLLKSNLSAGLHQTWLKLRIGYKKDRETVDLRQPAACGACHVYCQSGHSAKDGLP